MSGEVVKMHELQLRVVVLPAFHRSVALVDCLGLHQQVSQEESAVSSQQLYCLTPNHLMRRREHKQCPTWRYLEKTS